MVKENSAKDYTFEDILREKLQKHISRLKHIDNGNLYDMVIQLVEAPLLKLVLQETRGNQVQAAAILGINRNTLRKKIKELQIKVKKSS